MQRPPLDPEYRQILEKVRDQKLRYNPSDDLLEIAIRKPQSIVGFVLQVLNELPGMHSYWASVLDLLPEGDWPVAIEAAVADLTMHPAKQQQGLDLESLDIANIEEQIKNDNYDEVFEVYSQIAGISGKNMAAESVIRVAANQFPKLLHPYLKALFAYNRESQNFFGMTPFLLAGAADHDFLWDVIYDENASASERLEAFQGLLLSGDPKVIRRTIELEEKIDFNAAYQAAYRGWNLPVLTRERYLDNELRRVGYTFEQKQLRRLYNPEVWHVRLNTTLSNETAHPSWNTKLAEHTCTATSGERSGRKCNLCGGAMLNLLTIPSDESEPAVESSSFRQFEFCLSCANSEEVYFQVDAQGETRVCSTGEQTMAHDPPRAFEKPLALIIYKLPPRWYFQDYGGGQGANLYRLGGEPSWVQGAEYPECPCCERKMQFFLQHDMGYPEPIDERTSTHSDGMTYYFWCDKCRIYMARSQYT